MKRTSSLVAAIVAVIALFGIVFASAATAGQPKLKVSASQKDLVKGKLAVKVKGKVKKATKLKAKSETFDDSKPKTLSKSAKLKPGKKKVTLKLTSSGKKAVAGCLPREITVKGKGVKTGKAQMKRDTSACKPPQINLGRAEDCDFIGATEQQGSRCLLPFPDDYYTVADNSTETGRRVELHTAGTPANNADTHIDAQPYNLNDGFSPGQVITLKVPGLDTPAALANTDPIPLNDLSRNESQKSNEPIVVIDAATGQRVPIWVEIDSHSPTTDERGGADPRRDAVRGGPPLHRRDARPQELERQDDQGAGRLPLLPRRAGDERPGGQSAEVALRRIFNRAQAGEDQARQPLPGVGLHGLLATRTSPSACSRCATMPSAPSSGQRSR